MRIYANTFCILILTYLFTFMFTLCVPPSSLCALRVVCFYCLFVLGTFMRHARPCTRQHTHPHIHTHTICKTIYATYTTNLTPTHSHTTTHNNNKHNNNNQTGTIIGTFSRSPTSPGSWNDEDGALSSVSNLYSHM